MPATATKPAFASKETQGIWQTMGRRSLILCLLLALVTLVVYRPVSGNGFINYDDDRYILTNPHVRAGLHWETVRWAFTSFDEANWHPLTWLSHALDCQLFQLNAAAHHNTNILLHALNSVLLFLLLRRLTQSPARSLMVALLFAVHPLNVESVAWVAERKTGLSMLFFLLALIAYASYARKPSAARYLPVATLFACGLMSKPMVITLPFALLLLDIWPFARFDAASANSKWRVVLEKLPLFALSCAAAVVTMLAQKAGGAVVANAAHPLWLRIANALDSYALYIFKAFWPLHLAALYPYPHFVPMWKPLIAMLFLATITVVVFRYRDRGYLLVGWLWFFGTMVPMIGLVQVGNQAMADRYAYLPLIGLFILAVWGISDGVKSFAIPPAYPAAAGACVLIVLSVATRKQITYWHDDVSLWTRTLSVTSDNFVAENNLGAILARQGRIEDAAVHFRRASVLEPGDPGSQINLGIYAQQRGELQEAVTRYERTLQLTTDTRIRAAAYGNLGQIYFTKSDFPRARENYEAALRLGNPFPIPLGLIAARAGDWNQAVRYFDQAAAAEPSDGTCLLLSRALTHAGRQAEAQQALQKAEELSPDFNKAQQNVDKLLKP